MPRNTGKQKSSLWQLARGLSPSASWLSDEQKQLHRTPAADEGNLILGWSKENTRYCIFCLSPDKNKVTESIRKLQASLSWPMWVTATGHQLEPQPVFLGGLTTIPNHRVILLQSTLLKVTNQSLSKSTWHPRAELLHSAPTWVLPHCSDQYTQLVQLLMAFGQGFGQCFPTIYGSSVVLVSFLVFQDVFRYNLF